MRRVIAVAAAALLAGACQARPDFLSPATPHEAYARSLREAGLHETALGRDWLAAADAALKDAKPAALPLEMSTRFSASEAQAFGYRLTLKRGRVLRVEVTPKGEKPALIFLDLFRAPQAPGEAPDHVESAERGSLVLDREIERDGEYLVRIQPELLRGGTLEITQRTTAALAFPVAGQTSKAVQSFFLDPRDGGRREHHGVDIFAPRNTPVLAASSGLVSSVATTNLGGLVVWVWDPRRRQSHYYAHLSKQAVRIGQRVEAGDVIGYVGNTGNARGTPPHLHFGIYARGDGPIDPLPFVQGAKAPPVAAPSIEKAGLRTRIPRREADARQHGERWIARKAGIGLREAAEIEARSAIALDDLRVHAPGAQSHADILFGLLRAGRIVNHRICSCRKPSPAACASRWNQNTRRTGPIRRRTSGSSCTP